MTWRGTGRLPEQGLDLPDASALQQILDGKIHVLGIDEFRRRRFRRKGKTLFEIHFDSMLDPSEHFLGGEVLRHFPPRNAGLKLA